ncbi:MAG: hypothetical protein VB089_00160 [Anaerolineaceae bacterium]|nr:hypothetical protein [Anaerolineaceae bacterium]
MHVMKHHCRFNLLLLIGLFIWLLTPGAAWAQSGDTPQITVQAGFGQYYRDNTWVPVWVTLENNGPDVEARVEVQQIPAGSSQKVYSQSISLPGQSRKAIVVWFYPEGYLERVDVRLMVGNKIVTHKTPTLQSLGINDRLFGILAESTTPFNQVRMIHPVDGSRRLAHVSPADLPEDPGGLDIFDHLLISSSDTGSLTAAQVQVLSSWVSSGGRLILSGGAGWQPVAAGLGELLPFQPEGIRSLDDWSALAQYSGQPAGPAGEMVVAVGRLAPGAQVVAGSQAQPLVVRRPSGLGEVVYLSFDPAAQPFASWDGRQDFYSQLMAEEPFRPTWMQGFQDWGWAVTAINNLPNLNLPQPLGVISFLLVYVAVVGPLNFFILGRLKRRELAWVTIPALVVLFSLFTFLVGSFGRGKLPVLSRLAVVQAIDPSQPAQVDGLIGVFSPNRATYSLQTSRDLMTHSLPDSPDGAFLTEARNWQFLQQPGAGTTVKDIPVDVGSIQSVAVHGQLAAPDIQSTLVLKLDGHKYTLEGEIANHSDLSLEDTILLTPGGVELIGALAPGDNLPVRASLRADMPASYNGTSSLSTKYGYYPISNSVESWVTSLAGGIDYYSNNESYQRYALLSAIAGANSVSANSTGGEIYLAGWSHESPLQTGLIKQETTFYDQTLYFVRLDSRFELAGDQVTLSPGMFNWSVLDSTQPAPSPYDTSVSVGSFSLAFTPVRPLAFRQATALTLHIENYGSTGPVPFSISLWDYTGQAWVEQAVTQWGNFQVPEPQRYLSSTGEVRLRVESQDYNNSTSIEKIDFDVTLAVQH